MAKLKILCFMESDPEVRNFLHSGSLNLLFEKHDVELVLPPKNYKRLKADVEGLKLGVPVRRVRIPERRLAIWKRLYHLNQMRFRLDLDWLGLWLSWWGVVGWKAGVLFSLGNLPLICDVVKKRLHAELLKFPCKDLDLLVEETQPDIVIHPSTFGGYFVNDFVDLGKRLSVPTFLIMNSWDNPSSKRAMSGEPDRVGVWGEQTVKHTQKFAGIPRHHIIVLGAAQFEVYRSAPRITPSEFRSEHGLSPRDIVLLYAGSSRGTQESLHLEWINRAIEEGDLPMMKVVYRPHPWGIQQDQAQKILSSDWKNVVVENSMYDFMKSCAKDGKSGAFYMAEYARTHDILSSVDMVVSPLSTVIIEGALHGKPVMCFYPKEEEGSSLWKKNVKRLPHFDEIFKSKMVITCLSHSDLIESIRKLNRNLLVSDFSSQIEVFSKYFVEFSDGGYRENLNVEIENFFKELSGKTSNE
ncbi:hypothetical protein [Thalassospira sp. GB04J01]|uniref:hypothetical protein n=1 Tax=Thalassospira sp. GB04J01 TaxID=1485225 RepID=UPI000C9CCE8C|nr:hypothetical protein [Thalassospira sp. GB04J01]|tara:strand:+ start:113338 stop:114741 length:1404 start_codon:yes stop_codon:yes gene_type:complete